MFEQMRGQLGPSRVLWRIHKQYSILKSQMKNDTPTPALKVMNFFLRKNW